MALTAARGRGMVTFYVYVLLDFLFVCAFIFPENVSLRYLFCFLSASGTLLGKSAALGVSIAAAIAYGLEFPSVCFMMSFCNPI